MCDCYYLEKLLLNEKKIMNEKKKLIKCQLCNSTFSNRSNYLYHVKHSKKHKDNSNELLYSIFELPLDVKKLLLKKFV